jgi:hypothetical protein
LAEEREGSGALRNYAADLTTSITYRYILVSDQRMIGGKWTVTITRRVPQDKGQ